MNRVENAFGEVASWLVSVSCRRPAVTLAICLVVTAGALYAAATGLEVDTDSDRLLSEHLPVRQTNIALAEAFPALRDNLVVMIEADETADARDAAVELRDRLATQPALYPEIFLPGYGDYYDEFGLFYVDGPELASLSDRIDQSGPLLATLVDRPELPILVAALSHIVASEEGLDELGDDGVRVLDRISETVEVFAQGGSQPIDWGDLLFEDIDEGFTDPQLLFVRPAGDLTQMQPVLEAIAHIRSLIPELTARPGLRVRVTGDRATHTEEMSLIITEVAVAGATSLLLVTLLLFYCLRSFRLVLATVLTLVVGLAWTAGFAALAIGRLNALTSAFAVLYIGLGVDFGIHFALGYLDFRDEQKAVREALRACGRRVGASLILCALTTAVGFFAFVPTEYSAVADIGVISGSGVFIGLLATLSLYPALIMLGLRESDGATSRALARLDVRLPRFPLRRPGLVCGVALVIGLVCAGVSTRVRFDFSTLKVRDPRVESVQALGDLLQNPDLSVWTIDVIAQDVDEARAITPTIEALDGIEEVRTIATFLPDDPEARLETFARMRDDLDSPVELTEEELGDDLDRMDSVEYTIEGYSVALDIDAELRGGDVEEVPILVSAERLRGLLEGLLGQLRDGSLDIAEIDRLESALFGDLPTTIGDVVEALPAETPVLADLPDDLASRYLSANGRARVEVVSEANLNDRGELERFLDVVQSVRPDAGGPAAGTVALGRAIIRSFQQALVTAVAVITLLLVILLGSVRYALITLAPLALGSVTTAAVSVVADIPFNFANMIVLPLILGIGVDSGIHLVHRHRTGLAGAADLLDTSTARGVFFSAATTVSSFATLAFSNHQGIASLAQMLCVGVLLMLAANVLVLPAVLSLAGTEPDHPGE